MTGLATADLRDAPLTSIRSRDLRAPDRDLWADEAALWDRLTASWAGLDDAAWHLPGAAPSDAGGPDWSLAEHVGHIADWQELAVGYTARALETGRLAVRRRLRRRRLRHVQRAPPRAVGVDAARRDPRAPRGGPAAASSSVARAPAAETIRDDPGGAGSTRRSTATTSTISRSSSRGPTSCAADARAHDRESRLMPTAADDPLGRT